MREEGQERRARLAVLAGKQHGVVAYWQLIRLGFDRGQIDRMGLRRFLHRLHRGVYAVGHPEVSREGRLMAAVLTGGPDAVLSHWSAAEHWELLKTRRSLIAISAPTQRRPTGLVKPHWVPRMDKRERTRRDRIPITTVQSTLLDLPATGNVKQPQRAVNEAERRTLLKKEQLGKRWSATAAEPA